MAGELGRRPYTIFELDVPRCQNVYGSAPCTAVLSEENPNKCYGTRKTCQDPENYDPEDVTHSYVQNIDGMPKEAGFFPMLQSVSTRAAEVNLSGIDPNSTALGTRARGSAALLDAEDNGSFTDPYAAERRTGAAQFSGVGYLPEDAGTHLGKLFSRTPYYQGLSCRVKRGYVGDDPATMPVEHYVISEATGPSSDGKAKLTFKDILDFAENEKAVAPEPSSGKLFADIDATATNLTLTPPTVGDEYPESGIVRVGRELMHFDRVDDVLTVSRGEEGTEAANHSKLDSVQLCLVFDAGDRMCDVGEVLLRDYADVPQWRIPIDDWREENDSWIAGVDIGRTIISKPEGVTKLIGEMCQLGVMFFPDVATGGIGYKVNAPLGPGQTYYEVNEASNLREGTVTVQRGEDRRVSSLLLYHGVIDWTGSMDSTSNYSKVTVASINDDPYDQQSIKEMTVRWYGRTGNDSGASVVTERLLARYEKPPKVIAGELDVKDRAGVSLTSRLSISSRLLQDENGFNASEPMQVNYAEYTADDRVKFKAETYSLEGRFGFWMDDAVDEMDYGSATDTEKDEGAYWWDETEPDWDEAYVYF